MSKNEAQNTCKNQNMPPQGIPCYTGDNMGFNVKPEISSYTADIRKLVKQDVDCVTNNF